MNTPDSPRRVRSFVRRAGRMTDSQRRAIDALWPVFGLEPSGAFLDFDAVFGRAAPRVLEIGFGNGETLVAMADAEPAMDFVGIEEHEPGIGHCLIAAREAGISNLRIIAADAVEVLEHAVAPGALSRINLYFPDPWPKKRHHKRRIVQPAFVELCARALGANGCLCIATDWANYAEHIDEVMGAARRFTRRERRIHDGDRPLDRPVTKFERRGLRHGHRIWDWCFDRIG